MLLSSKFTRIITYDLGISLLILIPVAVWIVHDFRSMRLDFHFSHAGLEPLEMALKKAASDVVVAKRGAKPAGASEGYLVAYQEHQEVFRQDAKLFDTWSAAAKLGLASLKSTLRGNWVRSSADAQYVPVQDRIDPWEHNFCLLRRNDDMLVVSAGPNAPGSPSCRDIQLEAKDLAELTHGKLLETPAGYFLLVVDKSHADRFN